ncbi:recombinase family protein [Peribacillus frigoritolerans]|uniref:recombinase family protein n=1 Tax=Peribacillus frigoritolerans TaxID=450367 RepID=UPI00345CD201
MNSVTRSVTNVTKIYRLARSIMDLNKIVQELAQKGIKVKIVKETMEFLMDQMKTITAYNCCCLIFWVHLHNLNVI